MKALASVVGTIYGVACLVGYAMISVGWLIAAIVIFPLIPFYPLVVLAKYRVWPGVGWLGLVSLILGAIAFRDDESTSAPRARRARLPETLPGGYLPGQIKGGLLYKSDPLPPDIHGQDQVAKGLCAFKLPVMAFSNGPSGSPPLGFKMTRDAIWTLNTDGSLYEKVTWDQIHGLVIDQEETDNVRWWFRGTFVHAEFMMLDVEPSAEDSQSLLGLAQEKGIPIEVKKP